MESSVLIAFPRASDPCYGSEIIEALEVILGFDDVVNIGPLRNPNTWCVGFADKASAAKILQRGFLPVSGHKGIVSDPCERFFSGRISWIPAFVPDAEIIPILEEFCEITDFRRESTLIKGRLRTTNCRSLSIRLKEGVNIEEVPHLFEVGQYQGLLWLCGRKPKCLHCGLAGHIRSQCPAKISATPLPSDPPTTDRILSSSSNDDSSWQKVEKTKKKRTRKRRLLRHSPQNAEDFPIQGNSPTLGPQLSSPDLSPPTVELLDVPKKYGPSYYPKEFDSYCDFIIAAVTRPELWIIPPEASTSDDTQEKTQIVQPMKDLQPATVVVSATPSLTRRQLQSAPETLSESKPNGGERTTHILTP